MIYCICDEKIKTEQSNDREYKKHKKKITIASRLIVITLLIIPITVIIILFVDGFKKAIVYESKM